MVEVDLHVGAHRIFGQVLNIAHGALKPDLGNSVRFVGEDYKTAIIPALEQLETQADPVQRAAQKQVVLDALGAERIVLSKASLLCRDESVYSRAGLYPRIDPRLAELVDLFSGCDVVLHVCITNMYDFLRSLRGLSQRKLDDALAWGGTDGLLWCQVIAKIQRSLPGVPIIVWDCERKGEAALDFASYVFDTPVETVRKRCGRRGLRKLNAGLELGLSGPDALKIHEDYEERLDVIYEADLEAISRMEGVTLCR